LLTYSVLTPRSPAVSTTLCFFVTERSTRRRSVTAARGSGPDIDAGDHERARETRAGEIRSFSATSAMVRARLT
jgi:hypothetical protein